MSAIPASGLAEVVASAGGVSYVARLLGLSYVAVWTWATGRGTPRLANLARLRALPRAAQPVPLRRAARGRRAECDGATLAHLITTGGGTARVSRALGVAPATVIAWRSGKTSPTAEHLARLAALPPMPPLKPGRPALPPGPESALIDQVLVRVGNVSASARRLGISRKTMQRLLARKRGVAPAVLDRAREILAS